LGGHKVRISGADSGRGNRSANPAEVTFVTTACVLRKSTVRQAHNGVYAASRRAPARQEECMETLKKIVTNQYFPAAAVLTAVVLFWTIAMFGGLSLLNNNQPPMATLTWMLFVYAAAVLTPLAGVLAGVDLVRRWRRNRMYALAMQDGTVKYGTAENEATRDEALGDEALEHEQVREPARETPAQPADPRAPKQSAPKQPAQHRPATQQQPLKHPVQQPAKQQPAQTKQRKKAA
jgi:hypothetical protein